MIDFSNLYAAIEAATINEEAVYEENVNKAITILTDVFKNISKYTIMYKSEGDRYFYKIRNNENKIILAFYITDTVTSLDLSPETDAPTIELKDQDSESIKNVLNDLDKLAKEKNCFKDLNEVLSSIKNDVLKCIDEELKTQEQFDEEVVKERLCKIINTLQGLTNLPHYERLSILKDKKYLTISVGTRFIMGIAFFDDAVTATLSIGARSEKVSEVTKSLINKVIELAKQSPNVMYKDMDNFMMERPELARFLKSLLQ